MNKIKQQAKGSGLVPEKRPRVEEDPALVTVPQVPLIPLMPIIEQMEEEEEEEEVLSLSTRA